MDTLRFAMTDAMPLFQNVLMSTAPVPCGWLDAVFCWQDVHHNSSWEGLFFFNLEEKFKSVKEATHPVLKQSQDCSTCWMLLIYYDPLHTAIVPAITQIFTYRHWEVVSGVWRENKGRGSISRSLGNILGTRCLERDRAEQNPCCFGWQTFTAGTTHVATRRQFQVVKWMGPTGQNDTDFPL